MAALVLTSAVASFSGLTGFSLFAAQLAATAVGSFIDSRLFARNTNVSSEGPRLNNINVTGSAEGAAINRLYGRMRVGGNIIWCTRFEEQAVTTTTTQSGGGGKGGGGGGGSVTQSVTNYYYYLSFAVAFCAGGEGTTLGRIWADGRLLDMSNITYRFYPGTGTQSPDSYIQSIEGAANTPAYRGICYAVFERFPLKDVGNRLPQITAEIIKPILSEDPDVLENALKAVNLIPASGEFVYSTLPAVKDDGYGNAVSENVHRLRSTADVLLSLDDLETVLPEVEAVNIVISWFGDDLRAGVCTVKPKVERHDKAVIPNEWSVNGVSRAAATATSTDGQGRPIYGGTPSDLSVIQLIQELNSRGIRVSLYPFMLMDVPSGNSLPNPYSANAAGTGQAAFPWRGRITVSPAIGYTGTVDKTATAATQVDAFFGTCAASDISISGTTVYYSGSNPTQWGYRRMVLHYAKLCVAAGGVDAFFIGSEMVQLTRARSSSSNFPAVNQFVTLASDVAGIFSAAGQGSTKLSYAANWDEYRNHRPGDGTNDVYFNMDPLWQSSDIDFIGIDFYAPVSDWRNGTAHLDYDAVNGPTKIYDIDYIKANIEGGEYYDWYYASQADRDAQIRTPMTDPVYNKAWVFADKDFRSWWANSHYNRPGGTESGSPTSYTPSTKPIWLSEFGCPAVDKGTNEPNVFYDPKSAESAFPRYSDGNRDDYIQRIYYEALLTYWRDNGGSMLSDANMFAWTWDARPYPTYPTREDVWSDGASYKFGHWLNGRAGVSPLSDLVKAICREVDFQDEDIDVSALANSSATVRGYLIDSIMSPRDMLAPLEQAFLFDSFESEGKLSFTLRKDTQFSPMTADDLVIAEDKNPGGYQLTRAKETDLPVAARITFVDEENAYQPGGATGLKLVGDSRNVVSIQFPIVMDQGYARALADIIVQESWAGRETGTIALPPSKAKYDPGDGIQLTVGGRTYYFRITKITRGSYNGLELVALEPTLYSVLDFSGRAAVTQDVPVFGKSILRFMDLPLVTGQEERPWAPRLAAYQSPFPSAVNVYRDTGSLELMNQVTKPCVQGQLNSDFYNNRPWCWDRANVLVVDLYDTTAELQSAEEDDVLNGQNAIAVQNADGGWEVVQFVEAELIAPGRYKLTKLLRGQLGTESEMRSPVAAGAAVVVLDPAALSALSLPVDQKLYTYTYRYGAAELPSDSVFYKSETLTFKAVGLQPYAPTRLWVKKILADGTCYINWQRRTRFNGDDFDAEFVPLNEEFEKYDLEIYTDSSFTTIAHTEIDLTVPEFTYSAAAQIADFGSTQGQFSIRVYQKSAQVGRGRKAEQTVYTGI